MATFKEITELTQATEVSGAEKLPISSTQYLSINQIIGAAMSAATTVAFGTSTANYVPLTVDSTTKNVSIDGHTHSQYLTEHQSLSGYATQTWITEQGFLTSAALSNYITQAWVEEQNYLVSTDLSSYATQAWVEEQGYLASANLSGYATQDWVSSQNYLTAVTKSAVESVLTGDITSHTHSQYLTSSALSGYATQDWVSARGYLTSSSLSTKADSADIIELEQILALVAIDTEARLSAIEERLNGNMGSISVDTIDVLRAINLHSANGNTFTEGTSAPSAAPDAPLLVYYNKTSGKVYLSVGTTSSSMWIMLN